MPPSPLFLVFHAHSTVFYNMRITRFQIQLILTMCQIRYHSLFVGSS